MKIVFCSLPCALERGTSNFQNQENLLPKDLFSYMAFVEHRIVLGCKFYEINNCACLSFFAKEEGKTVLSV